MIYNVEIFYQNIEAWGSGSRRWKNNIEANSYEDAVSKAIRKVEPEVDGRILSVYVKEVRVLKD